ncbi:hypothetical protein B0T10DRAFT_194159 [Thelonectria olida]|uniref:Alcohol dehydrogenase iron-type/glycerol dehydrogenase GldA domain-containing protein n=1 Tax=Thelonectria olida TaxID=1576542 RepID=A0A9P8VWG8_9HYPO|nr:hypothetical protein B0T10DRAFT_194159 [Thelonectria olida]
MKTPSTVVKPLLPVDVLRTATLPSNSFTAGAICHPKSSNRAPSTSSASSGGKAPRNVKKTSPRIVFGNGVLARLPAELGRLHLATPLIVSSPSRVDLTAKVKAYIPNLDFRVLDPAIIESFPNHGRDDNDVPKVSGQDCVISVGGGSAVAVARMISSRKGIPHICIPTTYSGRELMMAMPSCTSETKDRRRRGRRGASNAFNTSRPVITTIIYDEQLTGTSSSFMLAPTGAAADSIAQSSKSSQPCKDANSLWSFINLPGI